MHRVLRTRLRGYKIVVKPGQGHTVPSDQPVNRDILIRAIGRNPDTYDPRALEVTLSRLRGKLGDQPPLKAVRNQGYRFAARLEVSQRRPRPADREND